MRLATMFAVLVATLLGGCASPTTSLTPPDVKALLNESDLITTRDTNSNTTPQHYPRLVHYVNRKGYILKVEDLGPDEAAPCKTFRLRAWQNGIPVEDTTNVVCQ